MPTIDEITAIDDPTERAKAAAEAVLRARSFVEAILPIRDSALRELRQKGVSYGDIAETTGVPRPTVVSITRTVTSGNAVAAAAVAGDIDL